MKQKQSLIKGTLVLLALVAGLAACSSSDLFDGDESAPSIGRSFEFSDDQAFAVEEQALAIADSAGAEGFAAAPPLPGSVVSDGNLNQPLAQTQDRLIIRTASLSLVVDDTLDTIDAITRLADSMSGFVVSSDTFQSSEEAYFGNITFRVPAERFDETLNTLKQLSIEVTNENITGQDVTEEFVDLDARLGNLKAAEEQLQRIMEDAQDTEDVLAVFNQLTQIRGQIESIQGRMEFLSESARLSTVHVSLTPKVVIQKVSVRWQPLEVVRRAARSLGNGVTGVIDVLIFVVIVIVPILAIIAIILSPAYFAGKGMLRRRRRRRAK